MRSFVLLVLLVVIAVGNTENAQAEQAPKEKKENRRENLIHVLKSLISKKSDDAKRDQNAVNVQEKGDTDTIREAERNYDMSYGSYDWDSYDDWGLDSYYYSDNWLYPYDYYYYWYYPSDYYYYWYYPSYYDSDWYDPYYYDSDWYDPYYYDSDWYDPYYYDSDWSDYYYDNDWSLYSSIYWDNTPGMYSDYGSNMWHRAKTGAKRGEEGKARERMKMMRSLEATNNGKGMVARSARPNPAEKRNRNKRIARKGHQNRALDEQHTRYMASHKRGQHEENVAKNKMAAMRARHEIPANRRMHVRNKMAGKENNENERKVARRKMSGEKKMEARNRMAARRQMAEQAKLEARKKMTGNENIEGKAHKAGGMGTMNQERGLLERLNARQLKARQSNVHEERNGAVETSKEADKMV